MKFTKEEAVKELAALYAAKGEKIDLERTINENVDNLIALLGENSEIELEAFKASVSKLVDTALGLTRKESSNAVKLYKEQHPEPQPAKAEPTHENPQSELEKRIAAMELELAAAKKSQKIDGLRSQLLAKMKDGGVKDEKWANALLNEVVINEDTDIDAKSKVYIEMYNQTKAVTPRNITPKTPSSTLQGDEEFKDVLGSYKAAHPQTTN